MKHAHVRLISILAAECYPSQVAAWQLGSLMRPVLLFAGCETTGNRILTVCITFSRIAVRLLELVAAR
ncbi:hypothetical protein [Pelagicoccus sp. SDUM812002]|uniref:hypothetical protein n=1 Tax=Pelagicoccus sp. SDUM812002 TaxID=3041266 RepID=UPI00280DAB67|nr:hypothetical protein [Pelagicoccus sp. SDUM812002]MDQ8187844.1 hypothetical protein [Pelagicoccus sp. SDUM812002]